MCGSIGTPLSVAMDYAGNVYVAGSGNGRIRMVNTAGYIYTIAGGGTNGLGDGGPTTSAQLMRPYGIAVGPGGSIVFSDNGGDLVISNRLRILTPEGARLVSPPPGSTLNSTTVTFDWTSWSGATSYVLWVGRRPAGRTSIQRLSPRPRRRRI
jgi:DNA-binding beta-propeller fold protein YncE